MIKFCLKEGYPIAVAIAVERHSFVKAFNMHFGCNGLDNLLSKIICVVGENQNKVSRDYVLPQV